MKPAFTLSDQSLNSFKFNLLRSSYCEVYKIVKYIEIFLIAFWCDCGKNVQSAQENSTDSHCEIRLIQISQRFGFVLALVFILLHHKPAFSFLCVPLFIIVCSGKSPYEY